jgi:acetoin utilization protein AcuB
MTVQTLLSLDIPPLAPMETVGHALYRLTDLDIAHLPVVDEDGALRTVVSEDDLLERLEGKTLIGEVEGIGPVCVAPDAHWYEAASLMARHHLSAVPVVDGGGRYMGVIRRSDLFDRFAGTLSTGSHGAILMVEVAPRDFSLSQLVHIIEQSDARVLSVSTQGQEQEPGVGGMPIQVTVKLNTADTARVKHVLEHHGYRVTAAYNEELTDEVFSHKLAEFLRYLEV